QSDHPAQRCVVARELVIVEQEPSEDRETLLFVLPAELAAALHEMREDGAALCDAFALDLEHGHFAERVDLASVRGASRLAAEEIHEDRFPLVLAEFEHQGDLVRVSRFADAMQSIRAHRAFPVFLTKTVREVCGRTRRSIKRS